MTHAYRSCPMSFAGYVKYALPAAALVAALALAGCGHGTAAAGQAAAPPPPAVSVAEVVARPLRDFEEFSGRLEPVTSASIQPRVGGFIETAAFAEGAHVRKGQV